MQPRICLQRPLKINDVLISEEVPKMKVLANNADYYLILDKLTSFRIEMFWTSVQGGRVEDRESRDREMLNFSGLDFPGLSNREIGKFGTGFLVENTVFIEFFKRFRSDAELNLPVNSFVCHSVSCYLVVRQLSK